MKPRYRYTAEGRFQFLTQDGFISVASSLGPIGSRAEGTSLRLTDNQRKVSVNFLPRLPVVAEDYQPASVSVPGNRLALPRLADGSPRLASLNEGQVVIVSRKSLLPALQPTLTASQNHHLAGGHEACRPLSIKQNNHVPLPHESTLSRFISPRG